MDYRKRFVVDPGKALKLKDIDPTFKGDHETAEAAAVDIERCRSKLASLQSLLYAEKKHAILIVLQAPDAGGKDGTVKHVFTGFNPQGVKVTSFKEPTPVELAHDFLWRVHPHAPAKGEVAIFNRSHYEDVLITRVHKLIDKATWTQRYAQIRDFEKELSESGATILKFFLHISNEEQLARFAARLDDPRRNWKNQRIGLSRARLLGRLRHSLRGRAERHQQKLFALVRHPGEPQMVPQSGGVPDRCELDGRSSHGLPETGGRSRRHQAQIPPSATGGEKGKSLGQG